MNASDSDSLVQTSKQHISKYENKEVDHGSLSFDEKKPSKRQKLHQEKMDNWETVSRTYEGVGKVIFDEEDLININKFLNMHTE